MIDRLRQGGWRRLLPFALLTLLAIGVVLPGVTPLQVGSSTGPAAADFAAAVGRVQQGDAVLVDVEADLGTYPEIRYATRAALADLLRHGASLAFVSFSAEGRAIGLAELQRLRDEGIGAHRLLDLGYIAGAEAGMVLSVTSLVPDDATGSFADTLRSRGGGIDGFDLGLVIAGNDMGPRTWVEQVETRLPQLPVIAVAPTFLRPELEPYLRSGQLSALLGSVRDGVAYGQLVDAANSPGQPTASDRPPAALALLLGMLVALGVIVQAIGGTLLAYVRGAWERTSP